MSRLNHRSKGNRIRKESGFTLIELLIVIVIIASVAVTAFVALAPAKRLQDARNARRTLDLDSLSTAINTYIVDTGMLPTGLTAGMSETQIGTSNTGCAISSGSCAVAADACVNLTGPLAPYLKSIPKDPKSGTSAMTNYSVTVDGNNIITVKSCGIEGPLTTATPALPTPTPVTPSITLTPTPTSTTFYVSKNGNNTDGRSWVNAWNELNAINWTNVKAGDTIMLDGGATQCNSAYNFINHATSRPGVSCGMLYTTQLTIGKSGTSISPITIKLSTDPGHNGNAVIFGGRTTMLPNCNDASYVVSGTARAHGILIGDYHNNTSYQYVVIDGVKRSGIMIYGAQRGVTIWHDNDAFITLRNLEIFDNGIYSTWANGYRTDYPGIAFAGHDLTFERLLVHDNGQDEFQDQYTGNATTDHGPMSNLILRDSWLYSRRDHPTYTGYPFSAGAQGGSQDCTHVDGVQMFGGGKHQTGFTVDHVVFGPLLAQGFYPGDQDNTSFDNVVIRDSLFLNDLGHGINSDSITGDNSTPGNWQIQRTTIFLTNLPNVGTVSHGFDIAGGNHSVTYSIFVNGYFYNAATITTANNNIRYQPAGAASMDPVPGSTTTNPQFVSTLPTINNPVYAQLASLDFTPQCATCAGKGSAIHSVAEILTWIDSLNGIVVP